LKGKKVQIIFVYNKLEALEKTVKKSKASILSNSKSIPIKKPRSLIRFISIALKAASAAYVRVVQKLINK